MFIQHYVIIPFFYHFQIIHLKRFQFLNGRWVKSQKIVKFPVKDFDPTNYLAPRAPKGRTGPGRLSTANGATNHDTNANELASSPICCENSGKPQVPAMNGQAIPVRESIHQSKCKSIYLKIFGKGPLRNHYWEVWIDFRFYTELMWALQCMIKSGN